MIGLLPKELNINGTNWAIRSDYRVALLIFQACADPELTEKEKVQTMIVCLFTDPEQIPSGDSQAANDIAVWFLEGGSKPDEKVQQAKKVLDWEQDERIIFSAINKVAGFETRAVDYMHWWTFLGYFNEIGEGLLSTVINIRSKKNKGKKLEKHEQEFYRENKSIIDLKTRLSVEEQEELDELRELLG